MPPLRNRWVVLIVGAIAATAATLGGLCVGSRKVDVRVTVTGMVRTNGVLQVNALVTNCGSVTVVWGSGDTPFSDVRWLSNDNWVTSDVPNGSSSSLGEIRPGESFAHTFEAPSSARRIQALAHFEVPSIRDQLLGSLIRGGIVKLGSRFAEWMMLPSLQRAVLNVASDEMAVKQ